MGSLIRKPVVVVAGSMVVSALLVLGCQAGAGAPRRAPTPAPKAAPTTIAVPALTGTYTSAIYGYSISYPEYFEVRPATRRLQGAETPWVDSAGVDQLNAAATMVIGSGDLAPGMDMEGWIGKAITPICGQPASAEPVTIGGEPGRLLAFADCNGYFTLWATTVHEAAGYHLVWVHDPGTEAEDRQLFAAILATFKFGEAPPAASGSPAPSPS